jgi:hypothetical protein
MIQAGENQVLRKGLHKHSNNLCVGMPLSAVTNYMGHKIRTLYFTSMDQNRT